jgi:hypothetical protein
MSVLILIVLLGLFGVLAVVDGFYLHIFKYQLHNQKESKFEHLTHTIRAVLFPLIVYFLFIVQGSVACFYFGVFLVLVDLLVLGVDAFSEKESRAFMGGLPQWEYILHLFVNGFHFSSIAVFLSLKLHITSLGIELVPDLSGLMYFESFQVLSVNLVPGAILLAVIHVITSFDYTLPIWNNLRSRVTCC